LHFGQASSPVLVVNRTSRFIIDKVEDNILTATGRATLILHI
jgi:hypothetical protein